MAYTEVFDPNYYAPYDYGYYYQTLGSHYQGLKIEYYVESQSRLENTTTMLFKVIVGTHVPEAELKANGSTRIQLRVDDVQIADFYLVQPGQVESARTTLKHNSYGQRKIEVETQYYNFGGSPNIGVLYNTFAIPTIPQGALIHSAPIAFNDEDNPSITYRSYNSAATVAISTNTDIDALNAIVSRALPAASEETSYVFDLTEEERDALRLACKNSKSMKLYFGVFNNNRAKLSYLESTFTVINAEPTATGTVKDINPVTLALTGDENTLIRFASTAQVSAQFSAYKKAAIKDYWIEHNTLYFKETSHTFEKVEGNIFTFHITDSRGHVGEGMVQTPMIEYLKLTCNIDTSQKPGTDGVMNLKCSGNYFNDTFGYTNDAVMNTLQVQYRYKLHGFNTTYTDWAEMPYTINDDGTYDASILLEGFDYQTTYVFQCRATDRLYDIESIELISKSLPMFHWGENDFVFEVPVAFNSTTSGIEFPEPPPDYTNGGEMGGDLKVDGDLEVTGNLRLKGDGNYGNTLYFGDGSYALIQEPTDDSLVVRANILNIDATLQLKGLPIEHGIWYPTVDGQMASSYSSNYGWYQRIGNVVTAGFYVKVTCKTGYHTTPVAIVGLPFEPAYSAPGGGLCSGALVNGGFNFQCWVLGTDKRITARVQACNNTSAQTLSTSASGLFYPQGGGEITVGGTITFMVE